MWATDDDPTLNAGLFYQGIRTSIAKKPYIFVNLNFLKLLFYGFFKIPKKHSKRAKFLKKNPYFYLNCP